MAADTQRLTSEERASLVAYLDGELPEQDAAALATKLTQSVSGRRELELLRATWELLDELPRPKAPPEFKERTVTLAVQTSALENQWVNRAATQARKVLAWSLVVGGALGGLGIGYLAARWLYPDPTANLARDLTVAERLEMYRAADSIQFLRMLDQSVLFEK